MTSLPSLPVLLKFSRLQEPSGGPILLWAFYFVIVQKKDPILFSNTDDFVPGMVVQYANHFGIKYEIKGDLIPHKSVAHNINEAFS